MKKILLFIIALVLCVSCSKNIKGDWYKASGDELECCLEGNATTGYQWLCDISNPGIVICEDSEYKVNKSKPGMVGVGGIQEFEFEGLGTGDCLITFYYKRVWEESPIETRKLSVSCKNGKFKEVKPIN